MKIYPDILSLVSVDRYMGAALVREQGLLIVWGETAESCIERASEVQSQILQPFVEGLNFMLPEKEKVDVNINPINTQAHVDEGGPEGEDWLEENLPEPPRRTILLQAVQTGLTIAILILALATGWKAIAIEIISDHNWTRLAFLAATPVQFWLALVSVPTGLYLIPSFV